MKKIKRENTTARTTAAFVKAACEAFEAEKLLRAECRRTYALYDADPEDREALNWWSAKTKEKCVGEPEFHAYSKLRQQWQEIVMRRHGYKQASKAYNGAIDRLHRLAEKAFAMPSHSIDEVAAKADLYQSLIVEAIVQGDADIEQMVETLRPEYFDGLKADLTRLAKHGERAA